jgi:hypothetical protein
MKRSAFLRLMALAPWGLRYALAGDAGACADPLGRGIAWLISRQSPDGAWRSDSYGAFRDGRALTPLALRALPLRSETEHARKRVCEWLAGQGQWLFDEYPVHLASEILGSARPCPELRSLAEIARGRLLSLQCPRTGGWSYALTAPPADGPLSPMHQANLAATTMAIEGLRAAGLQVDDAVIQRALPFVYACQNQASGNDAFDDGGFFEIPDDPARNKAGTAGTDRSGKVRYFSYASATADGLRALRLCGEVGDAPRVAAAALWLKHFKWDAAGGKDSPADLIYYTARSIARTARICPEIAGVAAALPRLLAASQEADGSWRNKAGEMREDCPEVATALALEAICS